MAEVKWIKLSTTLFDNRKIKQIECLPEGDAIIVIWVKLLCLAGNINDSGMVYFTKEIPYTEQMFATQFNRPLPIIQLALHTFESFGMIEIINNILCVSNWEKYQSIDKLANIKEYNRQKQRECRERKRIALSSNVNDVSMTSQGNVNIEVDKEVDKEKEKELIKDSCSTTTLKDGYKGVSKEVIESRFNLFWSLYPKKQAKEKAHAWFVAHKPSMELVDKMSEAIARQKKSKQWTEDNGQFIPLPSTWLNQKRWEDEVKDNYSTVGKYGFDKTEEDDSFDESTSND